MSAHPVQLRVAASPRMDRLQLLIRVALLVALGAIGCSSVYWILYFALPALAAPRISQRGAAGFLAEDGPAIVRVLRWLARAYAYLWLLTDALPDVEGTVDLDVRVEGTPTASSALFRLISSLPALVVLALVSLAAAFLWLMGAVAILSKGRLPPAVADFIVLTLRYQFRLAAYHMSLVDRYPSFDERRVAHEAERSGV